MFIIQSDISVMYLKRDYVYYIKTNTHANDWTFPSYDYTTSPE